MRHLRRLATVLLALVLLAGWQEALQHPLRHVADAHSEEIPVCEHHDTLDAVLGAIGGAASTAPCAAPVAERIASSADSPAAPALVRPASRGPPALL